MRARHVIVTLTIAGALLAGCAAATAGQPSAPRDAVAIGCDELAAAASGSGAVERSVEAAVGDSIRVTLCSNPSTGFSWEQPALPASSAVEVVDHGVVAPSGALVGAAGGETFTFRATAAGTTEVRLAYSQPWAGGTKGAWTVRLVIVAR